LIATGLSATFSESDLIFEYQVLSKEDWIGRRLVADRFQKDRVFICGDAAHLWIPHAGYGMNAGIADAANLSWMLAGVLNGWAESALLDAYLVRGARVTRAHSAA
jgi:2-polyprenyl-6-methoxyphenol hydroxylase-like FAD-dependent oxidoreductase